MLWKIVKYKECQCPIPKGLNLADHIDLVNMYSQLLYTSQ